ncbi:MAG: IclR family transcriptional regulator, partial [Rhizobiaceae bacterium]
MAGFERYYKILSLFSEDKGWWTVAEIAESLNKPTSTIYRNVRELVAAGFLESTVGSHFRLGSAIVEFDRTISKTDPLIRSGLDYLDGCAAASPVSCSIVLARLYGNTVMCVADARTEKFNHATSFERGRPMPITLGATSRAILAQLRGRRLDRLLQTSELKNETELGNFIAELKKIRPSGMSTTRGEVDKGLIGCAVPVSNKALGIEASLSCIF